MTRQEEIGIIAKMIIPVLQSGQITAVRITEVVNNPALDGMALLAGVPPLTEEEKTALQNSLAYQFLHVRDLNAQIFSEPYEPWLEQFRAGHEFVFWNAYKNHLQVVSRFDADTVSSIDQTTDRVLDLCGDPSVAGLGLRKGLVVGNVQSGKTADYIGLISKAADCGYKVVIVLAGLLNTLRSQTQGRIDEGFVGVSKIEQASENGRHSIIDRVVGVGNSTAPRPYTVLSLTTLQSDFTAKTAQSITTSSGMNDQTVYIAVAKKNPLTLNSLIQWFSPAMRAKPMLLIDDEADNAGVNYKNDESPTTINRLIRDLLGKFPRATYVGYTATPFANIFIDPDVVTADHGEDLFPRDFIVALDAPDRYMGPSRLFGENVRPEDAIVREITDNASVLPVTHKRTIEIADLPRSLKDALGLYILATAIRICRGDTTCHSSALVNVSRFISVHKTIATLVRAEIARFSNAIRVYGAMPYERNAVVSELHALYEAEYADCGVAWDAVQANLDAAAAPIEVLEIHMEGDARQLDYSRERYPNGRKVIAVGGFSLSRGLTLEGLCASYVIRNSRMYDTLMQMGRWFGYRHGYGDLCRVHLTPAAIGWYRHITTAMEELWDEFAEMAAANLTPSQFGLRVRAHPLNLIVTARNKMKAATEMTLQVELAGRHIEPNYFNVRDLAENRRLLEGFVSDIGAPNGDATPCAGSYWTNVSIRRVQAFVRDFKRLDVNMDTASTPICNYLGNLETTGVSACDVYLATTGDAPDHSVAGIEICRERFRIEVSADGTLVVGGGRQHVTGKDQERSGLSAVLDTDEFRRAAEAYLATSGRKSIPGRFYRRYRTRPLLVLHVVNGVVAEDAPQPADDCSQIVVWRLVFPGDCTSYRPERLVSYVLNPIAARQYFSEQADSNDNEEEVG